MRYYRYKNININSNNALTEQYKALIEDEKRILRKEKHWRKFCMITTLVIYMSCLGVGVFLLKSIPLPNAWFWEVLVIVGEVIIGFILLIACGVLTAALTMPLWKKVDSFRIHSMKKEIFSKACTHLRDYYQLQEPYIITKCFDATDEKFRNHDVCIFIVEDEIRITADLVHGFLHGERDLGCYAFKLNEISIAKQQRGNHLVAELRADSNIFLLGYRAKGSINQNFIAKNVN